MTGSDRLFALYLVERYSVTSLFRSHPAVAAFIAGVVAALGRAPMDLWPFTLVALVVFCALIAGRPVRTVLPVTFAFLLGHGIASLAWLYEAIAIAGKTTPYSPATLLLGSVPMVLHALLGAAVIGGGVWITRYRVATAGNETRSSVARSRIELVAVVPCLWAIYEWLTNWLLFGGFPMNMLGYTQMDGPLAGLVPAVGIIGLSSISLSLCGSVAWLLLNRTGYGAWVTGLIPALCVVGLAVVIARIEWTTLSDQPLRSVVGTSQYDPRADPAPPMTAMPVAEALDDLDGTDIGEYDVLFLPELTFNFGLSDSTRLEVAESSSKAFHGADVLLGFGHESEGSRFNAVGTLSAPLQTYHKRQLVPIFEHPPLPWLTRDWWSVFGVDDFYARGADEQAPLAIAGVRIAVAICYESAFSELITENIADAGLLFVASSDSWSSSTYGRAQMLQTARARALETGRPVVRSAVNGISAVIDRTGRVLQQSEHSSKLLFSDIYPATGSTPFMMIRQTGVMQIFLCIFVMSAVWMRIRLERLPADQPTLSDGERTV